MNIQKTWILVFVVSLAVSGCSTTTGANQMRQLGEDEVNDLVIGNTYTAQVDEGTWAEYYATGDTGYARAWGDWGRQDVKSSHVTHEDGTICHQYTGTCDWAGPEYKYCGSIHKDGDGTYFYKVLQNTYSPWKVGTMLEMEIKPGDPYDLAE